MIKVRDGEENMTSNKRSLVERVAEESGVSLLEAQRMVDFVLSSMMREVARTGGLRLTGFGTLQVKERRERKARNPQNNTTVVVPSKNVVRFTPGSAMTRYINGEEIPEGSSRILKRGKSR